MFIRHWLDCDHIVTHGRLREWVLFTRRQGTFPDKNTGAVMFNMDRYSRAVLLEGVRAEPTVHEGQAESVHVISGVGSLQVGTEEYPIRDGSSFEIPAGVEHRLANTGETELELLTCLYPANPGEGDVVLHNWREDGSSGQSHWYHVYRGRGAGRIGNVDIPPRKISHPHNHPPDHDEVWYVTKGQGCHWMGRELHPQGPGWAVWLEPEELHSLFNPTDEWVYSFCCIMRAPEKPVVREPERESLPEEIEHLSREFEVLAEAYAKTGIAIGGVHRALPRIRETIERIKARV
ncbi:MAG: cupin domain-containing protein [Candidatus Latescibacteria bacterium]|nr:cupin domain-containing protein [Candidatus Latescibacterota bacterium]